MNFTEISVRFVSWVAGLVTQFFNTTAIPPNVKAVFVVWCAIMILCSVLSMINHVAWNIRYHLAVFRQEGLWAVLTKRRPSLYECFEQLEVRNADLEIKLRRARAENILLEQQANGLRDAYIEANARAVVLEDFLDRQIDDLPRQLERDAA